MRVLVTGATGNVGKAVVNLARRREVEVVRASCHGADNTIGVDLRLWGASAYLVGSEEPFDMVVMAHGATLLKSVTDLTPAAWIMVMDTNLTSCVALTHALVSEHKLNDGALLVYCSSIQANAPRPWRAAYAVSKAGLEAFCRVVAVEIAPQGRAIALRLGQLTNTMGGIKFPKADQETLEKRAYLPWVAPDDVARLCFDLYEQKSMTGCVIELDSGQGRNIW